MKTKSSSNHNQAGSTLVAVMATLATLMVIVGIAVEFTTVVNRGVQRTNAYESAMAIGDGCMEILFANWRTTYRATPTQMLTTGAFSAIPTPAPACFPSLPSTNLVKRGTSYTTSDEIDSTYTISNYKVVAVNAEYSSLASASASPEPMFGQITAAINDLDPNTNPAIKTTPLVLNYIASADVSLPTLKGNVVAKVRRVFSKQQLSPWNWAIFYVDPLEIHPGPPFTVTGWVHTNSDLYTAHNTLTFADKVTYGSDWFVAFMPGDGQHNGETPQTPNYPGNLPPARDQSLQPFGLDSTAIFSTSDANPNNDSYLELIQPPSSGYSDPLAAARYWNQAGVVIKISDTPSPNTVTIGTPKPDGTLTVLSSGSLYSMFSGAITTNQTIQDNREGANVRLVTLDISKIVNGGGSGNPAYKTIFNGIVYIYDTTYSSSTRRAVRLLNGSRVPTTGLTVASTNPIYIQGDFNTGATGTNVPSNVAGSYSDPNNPPQSQLSTYTRAPCSVIADAVNLLSNSWVDANSYAGTGSRTASNTTINTAIVSGIVQTAAVGGDGSYSGGAENFPRFLEDWSSSTLTYYGSMVELYKSQQSIGEWGKANVYSPPTRKWFFDTNFRTTPPPGTLMVYSYVKGKWSVL
jgi:hypothetical protein